MRFKVNLARKKELQKRDLKNKPVLYWLPSLFILLAGVFTAGFLIYSLTLEDSFVSVNEMDYNYGEKNYLLIWTILVTVDLLLILFYVFSKLFIRKFTGKYFSERVNESLLLKDNMLEYGYQNYAGSVRGDRVIVKLPLNRLQQATYQKSVEKIVLKGMLNSVYYENYASKETRADTSSFEPGVLVLFDYFEPSLYQALRRENVEVKVYE